MREELADAAPGKVQWSLEAGRRLRQYEIIRELGRGGMGVVYLARDTRLGRRVAIKFLTTRTPDLTKDLLREARATATCQHENIVVIHEADEHEGMPYLVLEYLEGKSLRETMGARKLGPARVVELMVPVVRALVRAHERGIVHRDLKPENVFVTTGGGVKVLDFGIAALADSKSKGDTRDRMPGTLAYMAVEQFEGGTADERSDLWAVGIMLYELLAGHHPVQPLTQAALLRHGYFLDEALPRIGEVVPDLPHRLTQLIDRCLEKRKERRIGTARDVLAELELLMPGRGLRADSLETGPYPGLTAFQEGDADRFYGRGGDVHQVAARLRDHPMVAVVGASGLGKSSFVRAGLVPALRASEDSWEVLIVRPGRHPLQSLATVLRPLATQLDAGAASAELTASDDALVEKLRASPGHAGALLRAHAARRGRKVLVFVDQMEELYTLVPDEAERRAFTGCLSGVADDASAPLRVVVCMRSDFLDRVGEDRRFLDDLVGGLHFLQSLAPEALREALEAPVAQLGYSFESAALLTEMVDSLVATPGSLPLLQFAGSKLWEARDDRRKVLTEESYRRIGGISGVLAQHADQVVAALPAERRSAVRSLFQRLVTADGTRAIVDLAELVELSSAAVTVAAVRGLVDHLSQARLLVVQSREGDGSATVELVHESLISGWPMLRRWLDEGREDAAFREQLRAAAKQWEARERDPGLLWRGEAMEEARLWRARHADPLPEREQAFIAALIQLGTRAQNLRRGAYLGAIGLLSVVIAGGSIAFVQVRRAERAALQEADVAGREATRARQAEDKITAQLQVIRREQEAKAAAETEVQRGKQDLRAVNVDLQKALVKTEAESKKAQEAADRAVSLAESLKSTNAELEKRLALERAQFEDAQAARKRITTELR